MTGLAFALATLLFLYILAGEPYLGMVFYRRLRARLALDPAARSRYYRLLIGWKSAWVPAIGLVLLAGGVGPEAMGVVAPSEDGWIMTVAVVLGIAVSTYMTRSTPSAGRPVAQQAEWAAALLPANPEERRLYVGVALVTGICEELLYRGFVGFYLLSVFPGLPLAAIALASGVLFGLGHAYQGKGGVVQIGLMGIAFYLVYWFSSSLLPVMLLHTLSDLRVLALPYPRQAEMR
ncbi:MAG: CPBP family intramembrane glutamic endopeptidase [Chloroflexota bacterium]